jgi:hypothetical protein
MDVHPPKNGTYRYWYIPIWKQSQLSDSSPTGLNACPTKRSCYVLGSFMGHLPLQRMSRLCTFQPSKNPGFVHALPASLATAWHSELVKVGFCSKILVTTFIAFGSAAWSCRNVDKRCRPGWKMALEVAQPRSKAPLPILPRYLNLSTHFCHILHFKLSRDPPWGDIRPWGFCETAVLEDTILQCMLHMIKLIFTPDLHRAVHQGANTEEAPDLAYWNKRAHPSAADIETSRNNHLFTLDDSRCLS